MPHPVQTCRWHTYPTPGELSQAATQNILRSAQQAIDRNGRFSIVLAGGNSPRQVYQLLRTSNADWLHWHVYFGDERCLPPQDTERNSRMANEAWLDHVAIPRSQIHLIPSELGPQQATEAYTKTLETVGEFDMVLLGLGEDGHTASLFPGHDWGIEQSAPPVLAVFDSPKPPPDRVSLSATRLSQAHEVVFLVTGMGKKQAITEWRSGKAIPASAIAPASGVDVYLEALLLDPPG
ncbi:MAG: 6-phosphogluconolactonase [Betaproteobacteria bacterium]|nr:6-phosphogluconolactonase [Betaproteobacteria bacterium]